MKKLLLAVAVICSALPAQASPYFRLYGWDYDAKTVSLNALQHPYMVGGALLAPEDLKQSRAGSLLAAVHHSPKDGCLMPSIVCEDWSPAAIGASMNVGKITLDIGPLFNVLPWMQAGASSVLPDGNVKSLIAPAQDQRVTFSAGPLWEYSQAANKGYLRVFTGLALQF